MADQSLPQPSRATPAEIPADEATKVPEVPLLPLPAQDLLIAATDLCYALKLGGIADHLNEEGSRRFAGANAMLDSAHPATLRDGLLTALHVLIKQPPSVTAALTQLHDAIAELLLPRASLPSADAPADPWPDFIQTVDQVLKAADERMATIAPAPLTTLLVSPQIAVRAAALTSPPVTLWIEGELYIGASRDRDAA